jgi:5-methylthioadenosine/S-adenosylhomocysteine deaminase
MTQGLWSGCECCAPQADLSRRQFLCAAAVGAAVAPVVTASSFAQAQQIPNTPAAGRPILLKGGCVLTLDRTLGDFDRADVLVVGGKISAVAPNIDAPDAEVIDATKTVVMPGFVDTHRHMWQGFLRNVQPDASLQDYRDLIQRTFGPKYTPDDAYAGDYLSAIGALDAGVTTILNWSHIQNTPEHSDACVKALQDSGMRAVFAYGNPQNANGRYWEEKEHRFPGDIARLKKQYFSSDDQLVTLYMAAPSAPYEHIAEAMSVAREVGVRITMHAGVGVVGRGRILEKLNDDKLLADDTTYVHCCTLNDTEWKLLRDTGGTVSMAGYVEMLMGHGTPPIQKVLDLGLRPSLSVDVETSVPNDLFTQMRTILTLQKDGVWAKRLADEKNPPPFLKARDVLEFATTEGARANGLGRKTGSLSIGKDADIILLRADRLNVMPMNNAVGAVVTSMGPQNVDTVLVAGKVMKRNGQLVGIDWSRVERLATEARERAYKNAGLPLSRV